MHITPTVPTEPTVRPGRTATPPTGTPRGRRSGRSAPVARAASRAVEVLEARRLFAVTGLNNGTWTSVGPVGTTGSTTPGNQITSGQVSGIATDPSDPNTFYVASFDGGIWKTTDGGTTYTAQADGQPALNIGAIAISPSDPNVVYAGTGNGSLSAAAEYGQGILVTDNAGATWQLLATTQFAGQTFAHIAVDPTDPNTLYAAVDDGQINGVTATTGTALSGGLATSPAGIYKSTDGGKTWTDTTDALSTDDNFFDVEISPASSTTLFATFQSSANGQSGIYESIDGGGTWYIAGSFPLLVQAFAYKNTPVTDPDTGDSQDTQIAFGRVNLAISPSDPTTMYASITAEYTAGDVDVAGGGGTVTVVENGVAVRYEPGFVIESTDGGVTWTQLQNAPIFSLQGELNNSIAVDPSDPSTIYIGGTPLPIVSQTVNGSETNYPVGTNSNAGELYQSTNGGSTFTDITLGAAGDDGPGSSIESFTFDADGRLMVGTDQGVWRLDDNIAGSIVWTNLNANLADTDARSVAVEPGAGDALVVASDLDGLNALAGTTTGETASQLSALGASSVVVDPANSSIIYMTTTDDSKYIYKSTNGGATFNAVDTGIDTGLLTESATESDVLFMDPDDPDRLLLGVNDEVYESQDGATTWTAIGGPQAAGWSEDGDITAIGVGNHGTSGRVVYAAVAGGYVYVTGNDGASWAEIDVPTTANFNSSQGSTTTNGFGNGFGFGFGFGNNTPTTTALAPDVVRLVVDSVNSSTVFAVVGGFSSAATLGNTTGDGGHIFESTDYGYDWTDVTGNLPNIPVHSLVDDPTGVNGFTQTLYAGTDRGVYVSYDGGQIWSQAAQGLPDVPVCDLQLDTATGVLVAGTLGRGVWELSATYTGATIASRVFDDVNATGASDPTEPGVAGATVQLYNVGPDGVIGDGDDTLVATQTTDANGNYAFTNLAVGTYYLHFVAPTSYYLGPTFTGTPTAAATEDEENGLYGYAPAATGGSAADPADGNTPAIAITDAGTLTPTLVTTDEAGMYQRTIIVNAPTAFRQSSGDTTMTYTVTISPGNNNSTETVPFSTANATALAGVDYVATSGVLTFAPGVTTQTVSVTVLPSAYKQVNTTVDLDLTAPTGFVSSDVVNPGTIINTVYPVVSIGSAAIYRTPITSQLVAVPVTLSLASPYETAVLVTTADATAGSTSDYDAASYDVIFPAGATQEEAEFTVLGGTNPQLDKAFTVGLSAPIGVSILPGASTGTITILTNVLPTVSVSNAAVTESLTGATSLSFDVTLDASIPQPLTVNYTTGDGTAVAGTDYQAVSGTLVFSPGEVSQTVSVPVIRRFTSAQSLTMGLAVSLPSAGLTIGTPTGIGTITDPGTTALSFNAKARLVYTDVLGQAVTLTLHGPGTGQAIFLGSTTTGVDADGLLLTGTNAQSTVTVKVAGGGQTMFNSIEVDGSLNTFSGKGVNLDGTFTSSGGISSLTLGYLSDSTVTLGGTVGTIALDFNRVVDTSITSSIAIRSITAGAYVNTTGVPDVITAPSVGTRHIKGVFGGTIVTTATPAKSTKKAKAALAFNDSPIAG